TQHIFRTVPMHLNHATSFCLSLINRAPAEILTLSLHDALPISAYDVQTQKPILIPASQGGGRQWTVHNWWPMSYDTLTGHGPPVDRKSTRLNSSHVAISYAVFCLKKKTTG